MGRCSVVGAAANILVTQRRVFRRLPTGALLSEGIAPVDSPWKTLFDHPLHLQLPNQTSPFSTAATRATSTAGWAAGSTPAGALKRAMFRGGGGCRWATRGSCPGSVFHGPSTGAVPSTNRAPVGGRWKTRSRFSPKAFGTRSPPAPGRSRAHRQPRGSHPMAGYALVATSLEWGDVRSPSAQRPLPRRSRPGNPRPRGHARAAACRQVSACGGGPRGRPAIFVSSERDAT